MVPIKMDYEIVIDNSFNLSIEIEEKIHVKETYFTIKNNGKIIIQKKLNEGVRIEENVLYLSLEPDDTYKLDEKLSYVYDIKLKYNGEDKTTILHGDIKALKLVTNREDEV